MPNTTGRIEYSPDYKSASQGLSARIGESARMAEQRVDVHGKHQRLKEAVLEAARKDRAAETSGKGGHADLDAMLAQRGAFREALTALLAFESEHKIGSQS